MPLFDVAAEKTGLIFTFAYNPNVNRT